ncbi:phosphopantetheine-binding protein [Streptosporangium saharense]|uniref:Acyl carrier protein n=1 Tax=Streptosporangium saharense TaxID=1706840 RepID=A0A7W7QKZ7_9ACTN|nr:phosphopantetheine-binding protein [Streptosporangium saharense]MBB4915428.1 acyl carrier protein [Streptosporangium saharense]
MTISLNDMVEIWREVLMVDDVGPRSDFFDLGGHSLTATRIVQRVEQACGVRLPVSAVHDHPTPEALTALLGTPRFTGR